MNVPLSAVGCWVAAMMVLLLTGQVVSALPLDVRFVHCLLVVVYGALMSASMYYMMRRWR